MMEAGFAEIEFTPDPGLRLVGQMHERRAEFAHDPLCACAAAFRSPDCCVVLIAVDICVLDTRFVREVQQEFSARTGLPESALLLHATHTHTAPAPTALLQAEGDAAFAQRLRSAISLAAETALLRTEPASIYAGNGTLEQMGWNRRAMFADGSSRMYGHSDMPGFIGIEGPRDPNLPAVWARDRSGSILGVLTGFSTHPNCLEGERFYGADIPGEVRRSLRGLLGQGVGVVYLTGAAGNTAPSVLDPHDPDQPWRGEVGLARSGLIVAGEAAKVIASGAAAGETLQHAQETIQIPIRPWPGEGDPAFPRDAWAEAGAYYDRSRREWPERVAAGPVEVRVNVLRIGDAALCTSPGELFVEFGLAIKQASPAPVTMVAELTDGYVGYIPTRLAFSRGGYETWPAPSSQLIPEAGDRIVEATRSLLGSAFREGASD